MMNRDIVKNNQSSRWVSLYKTDIFFKSKKNKSLESRRCDVTTNVITPNVMG